MHKFVGGVQTPGVLVAKKRLFKSSRPPNGAGGGSLTDRDNDSFYDAVELFSN